MSASTLDMGDEDIIEIFVEEAGEVLQEIEHHLRTLKSRPRDRGALGELRRGFHTLKGSGRMAKATDIGELAWKVENMLNRALEGKIPVSEQLLELLHHCQRAMPRLVDAFRHRRPSGMEAELGALMDHADALSSGQAPSSEGKRTASSVAGDAGLAGSKLGELQRQIEQTGRRSDEALQRSEMAIQQTRRLAAQLENIAAELQERRGGGEVKRLVEHMNAMGRELQELRLLYRGGEAEPATSPGDLQQLIDQRVRARLAASERARQELEARLAASHQAAASARRLAIWGLSLGILLLVGAIAAATLVLG